jgi:glycosyltransferase involved in cell wall biosynthesis
LKLRLTKTGTENPESLWQRLLLRLEFQGWNATNKTNRTVAGPTQRPAVLLISPQPFFAARGSPIRVRAEAQALAELGFEVDLLAFPFGQNVNIRGVRLIRTPNPFGLKGIPIGPSFWKGIYDLLLFWTARRLVRGKRYHVVHCVEEAGIIGLLLRRRIECKLIFDKHSDVASHRGGRLRNLAMWLYGTIERQVIRRADAVITGQPLVPLTRSLAGHDRVYPVCDLPSTRREADAERSLAIRRPLERGTGDVLILYLGNFASYQGIELMFQAVLCVVRDRPEARFVIIGGSSDEVAKWRKWLDASNAGDAVVFHPNIDPDDVPNYLAAADILLSPRLAGSGAPLKHLDYLKANRAIVATDTVANRFYLYHSVALLTGTSAQEFADGIIRLIADPDLREQLAHTARRRIASSYDYPQLKQGLRASYDSLGMFGDGVIGREAQSGGEPRFAPAAAPGFIRRQARTLRSIVLLG